MNVQFENVPQYLKDRKQWVCHGTRMVDGELKDKLPRTPAKDGSDLGMAASNKPKTWRTFTTVKNAFLKRPDLYNGIGYVPTEDDNIVIADPDHVLLANGKVLPSAQDLLNQVSSYTEISPGGDGLHIIGFGNLPNKRIRGHEVWSAGKYVTITGNMFDGSGLELQDIGEALKQYGLSEANAPIEQGNGNRDYEYMDRWFDQKVQVPASVRHDTIGSYVGREISIGSTKADVLGALLKAQADGGFEHADGEYTKVRVTQVFNEHWRKYSGPENGSGVVSIAEAGKTISVADAFISEEAPAEKKEIETLRQRWGEPLSANFIYDTPLADKTCLVESLIYTSEVSIVYAPPGFKKSLAAYDMATRIASGQPWLPTAGTDFPEADKMGTVLVTRHPSEGYKTLQVNTGVFDFDQGMHRSRERIRAHMNGSFLTAKDNLPLYLYSMPRPWLDASKQVLMEDVRDLVEDLELKFLLIDTLSTTSLGVDENSTEMQQILAEWRKIAEYCDCHVMLLHHSNRKGDFRGSSSIEAGVDLMIEMQRVKNKPHSMIFRCQKSRGYWWRPFGAKYEYTHKEDTTILDSVSFYRENVTDKKNSNEQAVLDWVQQNPGENQAAIVKAFGEVDLGREAIRTILTSLLTNEQVHTTKKGKSLLYYVNLEKSEEENEVNIS